MVTGVVYYQSYYYTQILLFEEIESFFALKCCYPQVSGHYVINTNLIVVERIKPGASSPYVDPYARDLVRLRYPYYRAEQLNSCAPLPPTRPPPLPSTRISRWIYSCDPAL